MFVQDEIRAVRPGTPRLCLLIFGFVAVVACVVEGHAAVKVDFMRDVEPLLAARCVNCHGEEQQKGGLRLDTRESALKGGKDGPVIVSGNAKQSLLIKLVSKQEPDRIMPAKGEPLGTNEVQTLRAWIDQGASWPEGLAALKARSDHWSLKPLRTPAVPSVGGKGTHPVDAFLLARLATKRLLFSKEADRATLIRRLNFDLLGLPPTPAEVEAFEKDRTPGAYERLVDRLLASSHYGEHWARHWLDVVRYTESQGYEYDRLRDNAWHYRDYVIRALNEDKPYSRFMQEQVAGDVMEPVTRDGIVATSLLVCGPWDEAGNSQANATQKLVTREEEMDDMVSVVSQTFVGLTVNCARCHAHKFDPIPQAEYYRVKSVFDGVKHGERPLATPAELATREQTAAGLKMELLKVQTRLNELETVAWTRAVEHRAATGVAAVSMAIPMLRWDFTSGAATGGEMVGGARIEGGRLVVDGKSAFFRSEPIPRDIDGKTLEAWVALSDLEQGGGAAISIENESGVPFDAIVYGEGTTKRWMAGSESFVRTKDLDAAAEDSPPGRLIHMVAVYRTNGVVGLYRNGIPYGPEYAPAPGPQRFAAGKSRVLLGMRHTGGGRPFLAGGIQRAALYDRPLAPEEVAALFRTSELQVTPAELDLARSSAEREELTALNKNVAKLKESLAAVPEPGKTYAGTRKQPEPTHRLQRGDVTQPKEVVTPGALAALQGVPSDFGLEATAPEAQRRLRFAEWLTDRRNPLPARVMANRVWQFHFGQGFVSTPNDFGVSGTRPTHPELLDWLAVQFVEGGWSLKKLHRLIVTSAAYRQASEFRASAVAVDADDQLLWRFPPRRLEGEAVRDAMLVASGEMNWESGGPSFRPFEVLKFPASVYVPVDRADPAFNRRTVYRMNVNSGKEPMLDSLDCPDPSVKTPKRGVTTTPLQALSLMNHSFVLRQADKMAERSLAESRGDPAKAVQVVYLKTLARKPSRAELARDLEVARSRGLEHVCWALLNSTEFVYAR